MRSTAVHPAIRILFFLMVIALVPAVASANWLGGITFNHSSPSYLPHGESVDVSIDIKVTEPGGVRIYVLPYTNGSPTPGFSTVGSPLEPVGESTVTRGFTINSGAPTIDHVRIRMNTPDNSTQLLEFFVRVKFVYGPYGIFNIQLDHDQYSVLSNGTDLNIDFDYGSPGPDNVIIFARPYRDGSLVPGYAATGGTSSPPSGSAHQHFDYPTLDEDINQIHFTMTNLDQTVTLLEFNQTTHFIWRDVGLTNLAFSVPSPSMVHTDDYVHVGFDYDNQTGVPIRIWTHPYYDGSFALNGVYEGSPPVPAGSGTESRYFAATLPTSVNQVHLFVTNDDQSVTYVDHIVPVDYHFAQNVVTDITMSPEPPALLEHDEYLNLDFNYRTSHAGNIRIHALPYTRGEPNLGYAASGSIAYPPPSGVGSFYFRIMSGSPELEVDQIHFTIYNEDHSVLLEEHLVDTTHLWGGTGWVTPVPGVVPGAKVTLGQNFPNPFNPATSIPVELTGTGHVRLAVYDLRGRLVRTVADEVMGPGRHEISFDGTDLASGQYFYRLEGAGPIQSRSMTLVK